ncbi:5'-3' exonuclease PLD4 [Hippopotamus amphibius kiboko]|uniref:5'-3' exonuclease PLD4 n=1 Tax=Hippopotamus amphibius kiboko TaxID=575201 RepID=UPI00259A6A3D|nr:5'-3' exonuclease PLD4 [Hippopotamus amphibius kiboko]
MKRKWPEGEAAGCREEAGGRRSLEPAGVLRACVCGEAKMYTKAGPPEGRHSPQAQLLREDSPTEPAGPVPMAWVPAPQCLAELRSQAGRVAPDPRLHRPLPHEGQEGGLRPPLTGASEAGWPGGPAAGETPTPASIEGSWPSAQCPERHCPLRAEPPPRDKGCCPAARRGRLGARTGAQRAGKQLFTGQCEGSARAARHPAARGAGRLTQQARAARGKGLGRLTGPPGQSDGGGTALSRGALTGGLPGTGHIPRLGGAGKTAGDRAAPGGASFLPAPPWQRGWSASAPEWPSGPPRSTWPCHWGPHGDVLLQLQVRGTLALLCLGAVTVTYFLWQAFSPAAWGQVRPGEGPPGSWGLGSGLAWEPLGEEARRRQQNGSCRIVLVESIPQDLLPAADSPSAQPLAQAWLQLLDAAQESVHVASFYWSLTGPDIGVNDSSSQLGEALLQKLQQLLDRNVSLAVATSNPTLARNSTDLQVLAARGAQVRHVPMGRLIGGVLHSKFWVVDGRHVYMGSANMDWRSLTQVKELGAVIYNCSCLAQDLEKTFQTYWVLGVPKAVLPKPWPQNFSSHINRFRPLRDYFDGVPTTAYFSASPPKLCPHGRTRDLDALLAVMGDAREFIYASVMEYFPTTRFSHPSRYWPVLDTALRAAAVSRGVRVRLLVSCWLNTDPSMFPYLRSLQALRNPAANVSVDVKVFIVPVRNHSNIPFSRVNHSKFMVTEKVAYIGTSNWSEDYFSSTSGVGLVVGQRASRAQPGVTTVQEQLRQLFERDWSSRYAVGLDGQAPGQDCVWQG